MVQQFVYVPGLVADQRTYSVVETATTVVCPYASVSTASGGVVTNVIETTTYVSVLIYPSNNRY